MSVDGQEEGDLYHWKIHQLKKRCDVSKEEPQAQEKKHSTHEGEQDATQATE